MTKTINNSTLISQIDYNQGNLTIHFKNGRSARYANVPETVVNGLLEADSAGRYFNREIRNTFAVV